MFYRNKERKCKRFVAKLFPLDRSEISLALSRPLKKLQVEFVVEEGELSVVYNFFYYLT